MIQGIIRKMLFYFCFLYTFVHLAFDVFPAHAISEKRIIIQALFISVVFVLLEQYRERKKREKAKA